MRLTAHASVPYHAGVRWHGGTMELGREHQLAKDTTLLHYCCRLPSLVAGPMSE